MKKNIKRRRLLKIMAVATGSLAFPGIAWADQKQVGLMQWQGRALGADTSIKLFSEDEEYTQSVLKECQVIIRKYEAMFNLFDQNSYISLLNKYGMIEEAPSDFVELIGLSKEFYKKSNGAFDITIQPLWNLYQNHFKKNQQQQLDISREIIQTLPLIGSENIVLDGNNVSFTKSGMSISLNGIAQGYITDKITDYLKTMGFGNVLVDMGEYRALGSHVNGQPWRIGLLDPFDEISIADVVEIKDKAVSTSGGYGVKFDVTGKYHHLFNPLTGQSSNLYSSVTVIADDAATADALSTAFSNMSFAKIETMIKEYVNIETRLTYDTGEVKTLKS